MVALAQTNDLAVKITRRRYRIGTWVALAAILMLFTSLTSAYVVRAAAGLDWHPIAMPRILWLSTLIILLSSGTIESARRKLAAGLESGYRSALSISLVLGLGFLSLQLGAWRQLGRQGIYIASNPHSSFFYLLTATHGVHLAGGLLALVYLLLRNGSWQTALAGGRRLAAVDAVALYWHFMDALWIYLFLLLFFWR